MSEFDRQAAQIDPAIPENVRSSDDAQKIDAQVIAEPLTHEGWSVQRVYSQYTSREIFTDPAGLEWVRVSVSAFNPLRGDIKVACSTRGLQPILLRRRDAFVANLKGGA